MPKRQKVPDTLKTTDPGYVDITQKNVAKSHVT